MVVIKKEYLQAAKAAGACEIKYGAGDNVSECSWSDLVWAEENLPWEIVDRVKAEAGVPHLWMLTRVGSGIGDGIGFGIGDGIGDGIGYGDGFGDGYGCGDGYGYGSGDGDGDGGG